MSLLNKLSDPKVWEDFYNYKLEHSPEGKLRDLRSFIDEKRYLIVCENISEAKPFPLPEKAEVGKLSSEKKRTVYTYPQDENMLLKLLTYLLLRKYDSVFSNNLYSFRPGRGAKDAIAFLRRRPKIKEMFSYKTDIHNYFNSVPVEKIIPMLEKILGDDKDLFDFLSSLLSEERVISKGECIKEEKGIMAGTPLACFYANIYLMEMDDYFYKKNIPYARYSDDIILFAEDREKLDEYISFLRTFTENKGLTINPDKEDIRAPGEPWIFLGFKYEKGITDISPASLTKLKKKMRRKARALQRWRKRNNLTPDKAARAFIRIFNSKLFENSAHNELTWAYWFFPVINTSESLHEIDLYAQDCIRWLLTDTRTKARFNARYDDIKQLGYRSLVHEYYSFSQEEKENESIDN